MVLRNIRYSKLDISLLSHLAVMVDFLSSCCGEASDMDLQVQAERTTLLCLSNRGSHFSYELVMHGGGGGD